MVALFFVCKYLPINFSIFVHVIIDYYCIEITILLNGVKSLLLILLVVSFLVSAASKINFLLEIINSL